MPRTPRLRLPRASEIRIFRPSKKEASWGLEGAQEASPEARGGPGKPTEAQAGPGRPRQAQGGPGWSREVQGCSGRSREAQGGPGRPREGGPGKLRQAEVSPGSSRDAYWRGRDSERDPESAEKAKSPRLPMAAAALPLKSYSVLYVSRGYHTRGTGF